MVKIPIDHALADKRVIEGGGDLYDVQAALFTGRPFHFTLEPGMNVKTQLLGANRLNGGNQWEMWGSVQPTDHDQEVMWCSHYRMKPEGSRNRGDFIFHVQPAQVMNAGRTGYRIMSGPGRQNLMTAFMSGESICLSYFNQGHEDRITWQVASLERHLGMCSWFLMARAELNNLDPPQLALYNPHSRKGTYYPSYPPGS